MRRQRRTYAIFSVVAMIVAVGFFFIGRASVKKGGSDADSMPICGARIYATIEKLDGRGFYAFGLDVNDINNRGLFGFLLDENATILKDHIEIPFEELRVGDTIIVTYSGGVWESSPPEFSDPVKKIEFIRHKEGS